MNGTADPFNPWNVGDAVLYGVYGNRGPVLSAQASIDYFLELDGLGGPPARTQFPDIDANAGSTAERQRWTAPGKRNVTLIRIQGGGHGLPHPATQGMRLLGSTNRDFHSRRARATSLLLTPDQVMKTFTYKLPLLIQLTLTSDWTTPEGAT